MNVPNVLTIIRFFLVPLFVIVFFIDNEFSLQYALGIFILAGITDILDGYIARKHNLITKCGQVLDPLADKWMQATAVICLAIKGLIPVWFFIFFITKELLMVVGGLILYARKEKIVVPANKYGKIATIMIYVAVASSILNVSHNYIFIFLAIIATLVAFVKYLIGFERIVKPEKL